MKTYLIDGNNAMHKLPICRSKLSSDYPNACFAFLNYIKSYSAKYSAYKFIVFFDGYNEAVFANHLSIRIEWSYTKTADEIIKEYIRQYYEKKNYVVVSSDNELYNFSRLHSLEIISAEDFAKQLNINNANYRNASSLSNIKIGEKPKSAGKKEIAQMMKLFQEADR